VPRGLPLMTLLSGSYGSRAKRYRVADGSRRSKHRESGLRWDHVALQVRWMGDARTGHWPPGGQAGDPWQWVVVPYSARLQAARVRPRTQ